MSTSKCQRAVPGGQESTFTDKFAVGYSLFINSWYKECHEYHIKHESHYVVHVPRYSVGQNGDEVEKSALVTPLVVSFNSGGKEPGTGAKIFAD